MATEVSVHGVMKTNERKILPEITVKLFVYGVVRNLRENYYFETIHSFIKLHKNYD